LEKYSQEEQGDTQFSTIVESWVQAQSKAQCKA